MSDQSNTLKETAHKALSMTAPGFPGHEPKISPADLDIRYANIDDCPIIQSICNEAKGVFGFIMLPSLQKGCHRKELIVATMIDKILGFAHFHDRRDGVRTIYEMSVRKEVQKQGIGRFLLNYLFDTLPNSATGIRLKCPVDIPANAFYQRLGFSNCGVEKGRRRQLRIWGLETRDRVDDG